MSYEDPETKQKIQALREVTDEEELEYLFIRGGQITGRDFLSMKQREFDECFEHFKEIKGETNRFNSFLELVKIAYNIWKEKYINKKMVVTYDCNCTYVYLEKPLEDESNESFKKHITKNIQDHLLYCSGFKLDDDWFKEDDFEKYKLSIANDNIKVDELCEYCIHSGECLDQVFRENNVFNTDYLFKKWRIEK